MSLFSVYRVYPVQQIQVRQGLPGSGYIAQRRGVQIPGLSAQAGWWVYHLSVLRSAPLPLHVWTAMCSRRGNMSKFSVTRAVALYVPKMLEKDRKLAQVKGGDWQTYKKRSSMFLPPLF